MMANFGNSNLLGNQKRRNFIYNPSVSRPGVRNLAQESGAQLRFQVPNTKRESPYKRFKNSNGLPTKRLGEIATEDACRDLPANAFDEEIVDDFDDELLTAEQLDQCDRMVSRELETQRTDHNVDFIANLPQKDEHRNASRIFVPSSSHLDPGQGSSDEDELLASHCTQDYSTYSTPTKAHTNFTDLPGSPVNGSRIRPAPVVTNPEETANCVRTMVKGDSLLESFVECTCGPSNFLPKSNINFVATRGKSSLASNCDNNFHDHSKHEQMNSLIKEIEKLKTEFMSANAKVKRLEDEKFCKDGEIRILKDSLSHFENEEKKRQAEARATAEKQAREQSQHEKELQKQVENLSTQIQFKDREISQLVERNKKRSSSSTELCSTPQKKPVNLSEVFPTGSSFFQKKSPEGKVKSPRGTKLNVKDMETPGKNNSQRLSEGDNNYSESLVQSAMSSRASTIERTRAQRREAEVRERQAVQLFAQNFQDVELVQNLISPQEKEHNIPFQEPYNRTLNYGSIISLLTLGRSSCSVTQRTTLNDAGTSHTLRLFDTPATSKLQRSIAVLTQKDSLSDNQDNSLVLQTLSVLLNHCHTQRGSENMTLSSSSKHYMLSPATNFLPLIESHIANYVEQRTDSGDENFLGTCLPSGSPTPDSPDPRDSPSFESDHTRNLAFLQEIALISLRLLNIIVLYSSEVCEFILKSARVFSEIESDHENDKRVADREDERQKIFSSEEGEGSFSQHPRFSSLKIAIKKDPNRQMEVTTEKDVNTSSGENAVERTELLGYLFKLLVPQPKESMVVTYATLQVLLSLSRNCEVKYCTRMLPLLSESLLTQCLSRDWCLTSLSLVISLLTPLIRHHGIVKRLCSQSGECILLKIYQGWLFRPEDVSVHDYQRIHLQIVSFVNKLLSNNDGSILFFHPESECHCNIELIKCLVLMLDKVVTSLVQVSCDSLLKDSLNRQSLVLLRQSVFLLATLCLNDRLFVDRRIEVEHQYVNVISTVTRLYQRITGLISEAEVLAVQDLVDFEHIDGIDWSQESEDEIDETTEGMDVDE